MTITEVVKLANSPKYKAPFSFFKEHVFPHTLFWEGGSQLHKVSGDSGGYTIYGIAYEYNKNYFKNLDDFKDTVFEEAAALAFIKYYMPIRADLVPEQSRLMYFDMAFNMGSSRAVKIAQKCLGIAVDGLVGPHTLEVLKTLTKECLYLERKKFYYNLAEKRAKLGKFLKGWLNRTEDIYKR